MTPIVGLLGITMLSVLPPAVMRKAKSSLRINCFKSKGIPFQQCKRFQGRSIPEFSRPLCAYPPNHTELRSLRIWSWRIRPWVAAHVGHTSDSPEYHTHRDAGNNKFALKNEFSRKCELWIINLFLATLVNTKDFTKSTAASLQAAYTVYANSIGDGALMRAENWTEHQAIQPLLYWAPLPGTYCKKQTWCGYESTPPLSTKTNSNKLKVN